MVNEISLESTVVRSDGVIAGQVDKELVMMSVDRGLYYGLDAIGADIWQRLAQPLRVADLCAQLVQEYEVEEAECAADVLAMLNDMATDGLIVSY
jgi:hypothetical protein